MAESTSEYWQRLETLFHGAMEQPAEQRQAWLDAQCVNDEDTRREVLALLSTNMHEHDRADQAVLETARDVSAGSSSRKVRRLGPYQIIERIGSGGMGTVYLAERSDDEYRQKVAIKLIRGFPGDRALERLRQERQILANLNHPNIARLLDGGTTADGQPYLVMEYIDGMPIVAWARHHQLDVQDCVRLMVKICDALHYAHQHLVIHRDIKPGNVLVTEEAAPNDGPAGRPVLLDFGIAKLTSREPHETTRTARFYTPGYASPEQLSGGHITTATDVYSLGRLLLALLNVDVQDSATQESSEPVFRRASWKQGLPADLTAIADQATRTDPEDRYATASALREDLIRFLEGRPVQAVPSRLSYRLGKFIRRHQAATLAVALALVVGATLLWRLLVEYDRAHTAEAIATQEALRAQQTSAFMLNMLGSIEPEYADGADTTLMRRVLEDAAQRAHRELENHAQIQSDIQYAIGRAYQALGEHDMARNHLEVAAELVRETPDTVRYLDPQHTLAQLETAAGEHTAGLVRVDRILDGLARLEPADDFRRLDALLTKANLLIQIRENRTAEELLEEILTATENATEAHPINIRLEAIRSLANLHSNTNRYEESSRGYHQVIDEATAWGGPAAKRHIGASLNDLGVVLLRQQKYVEAEPVLRQSMLLTEQRYGIDHPRMIHVLSNLAGALRQQGRPDEAAPLFERALTLALDAYGPDQTPTLMIKYNYGNLLRVQGDTAAAIIMQSEALAGVQTLFPDHHPVHGMMRLGLGQSHLAHGNHAQAIGLLEESDRRLSEHHGADYYRAVEAREALAEARKRLAAAGSPE